MDLRIGRTFYRQTYWVGSGGQQECAKFEWPPVLEQYLLFSCIKRCNSRMEEEINLVVAIIVRRPQRNPIFLSRACEVVLGKVRAIHRRRVVGTHDSKRTVVALSPKHVGRSQARGTSTYYHNRVWPLRSAPWKRVVRFSREQKSCRQVFPPSKQGPDQERAPAGPRHSGD